MSAFTRFTLICAAILAALACVPDGSTVAGGGIGGSGISRGPITGFGSVFVNGIEWDTSEAEIEIEDVIGDLGDEGGLEIGMVVEIEGDFSRDGTLGIARSLRYEDELEGPITGVAPIGGDDLLKEIRVLGELVVIERGVTSFHDDDPDFDLDFDNIDIDDVVEVSGQVDESGRIVATFIEWKGRVEPGTDTEVELKGVIEGFVGGTSFQLEGFTVNFDPSGAMTDLSELPGGVDNGLFVEVEGDLTSPAEIWANEIELEDEIPGGDEDLENLNLEGIVSDFNSVGDFRVAGQRVDATRAEFGGGSASQLQDGIRVKVEGPRVADVLRAKKVEFREADLRVQAAVANASDVDPGASTLRLLGIEIQVNAGTSIKDERDGVEPFGLADIEAGDLLGVRGVPDGAGGIIATLVERNDEKKVALRGLVEALDKDAQTVTILGVTIQTDPAITKFEGEGDQDLSDAEFFAVLGIGDLVSVKDEDDVDLTAIDVADEIEIERAAPPPVSAGLGYLAPDLPEAISSADDAFEGAGDEGSDGEGSRRDLQMVRTVRLYFATVEARAREARERARREESR